MCTLALVVRQVGWDIDKFDAVCADRYPWKQINGNTWGLYKGTDAKAKQCVACSAAPLSSVAPFACRAQRSVVRGAGCSRTHLLPPPCTHR